MWKFRSLAWKAIEMVFYSPKRRDGNVSELFQDEIALFCWLKQRLKQYQEFF